MRSGWDAAASTWEGGAMPVADIMMKRPHRRRIDPNGGDKPEFGGIDAQNKKTVQWRVNEVDASMHEMPGSRATLHRPALIRRCRISAGLSSSGCITARMKSAFAP
jgi:hypothetical protein